MSRISFSRQAFARHERGSVAIVFALLATALFGMIAFAVDMARAFNTSGKLTDALDAAALAGAKALDRGASNSQIQSEAQAFFSSHMATLGVGGVTLNSFNANIDRRLSTVTTSVEADMATTFGRIIGQAKITLNKSAAVVYKTRNVELAMALDVTGSMADGSKLSDMKAAAKDVIDTLLEDAASDEAVRVALLPWSTAVNAGTLASTVSGGASLDGCVIERTGSDAATDAYPSGPAALPAVTTLPYGYYACPPNPITPLTGRNRMNDLKADIDSYTPYGGTAGHIGAAWGWYTIAPTWSGVWPTGSVPNPYNTADTIKSVLIMTDGMFNLSYLNGSATAPSTMIDESYSQFQALCTAMKAKKVVIYTVGFGLTDTRAVDELKTCASSEAQFFGAATGSELKQVFTQIATQLKSMRLTR